MELKEVVKRINASLPLLRTELCSLVDAYQMMESLNKIVVAGMRGEETDLDAQYQVIHRSLAFNCLMGLARVFDFTKGRGMRAQDKASIPVINALFQENGAEEAICGKGVTLHLLPQVADKAMNENTDIGSAAKRLRSLRNDRLAHVLHVQNGLEEFYYRDVDLLLRAALEVGNEISTKVEKLAEPIYGDYSEEARHLSERFAKALLAGLQRDANEWRTVFG